MLLINIKQGQAVNITLADGREYAAWFEDIGNGSCEVTIRDNLGKLVSESYICINEYTDVLPGVVCYGKRIVHSAEPTITVGFDASRDIKIRGNWNRVRTQLSSLSDKELVTHAYQIGTTKLEHELAKRLESRR